jgi:hypothetical protein
LYGAGAGGSGSTATASSSGAQGLIVFTYDSNLPDSTGNFLMFF